MKLAHGTERLESARLVLRRRNPVIAKRLSELGVVATPGSPEEFDTYMNAQTDLWSGVVKSGGIQPE